MSAAGQSVKDSAIARAWAVIKQGKTDDAQGLPSRTWTDIPIRTRAILVMLGASSMEDPREVARRPWASLSEADREGISACAREIRDSLRHAACLF